MNQVLNNTLSVRIPHSSQWISVLLLDKGYSLDLSI